MGIVTPEPIRDAHFDGRMIDDLRALRATWQRGPSIVLDLAELDALLAAADERDALKREATADPKPSRSRARMVLELSDDADDVARALARYLEPSVLRAALKIADPKAEPADDRFYCFDCGAKVEREKASPTGWKHAPREVSFSTPGPVGFDHYARVV